MVSNGTTKEPSSKMSPSAGTTSITSPKKFLKAFHSSPFKSNKNKESSLNLNDKKEPEKSHARTQSFDQYRTVQYASDDRCDWIKMICPIPQDSPLPVSLCTYERSSNRHTIAMSPSSTSQQLMQPLSHDPQYQYNGIPIVLSPDLSRIMPLENSPRNLCENSKYPLQPSQPPSINNAQSSQTSVITQPMNSPAQMPISNLGNSYYGQAPNQPQNIQTLLNQQNRQTHQNQNYQQNLQQNYQQNRKNYQHQNLYHDQHPQNLQSQSSCMPQNQNLSGSPFFSNLLSSHGYQAPYSPGKVQTSREITVNSSPKVRPPTLRNNSHLGSFHQQPSLPRTGELSPMDSSFSSGISRIDSHQRLAHQSPIILRQSSKLLQDTASPSTQSLSKASVPKSRQNLQEVGKKRKVCHQCKEAISGQFVRAINNAFHLECFKCHYCGVQCSSKFFSLDVTNPDGGSIQVPLCEFDYFKKLNLICFSCNTALRGPYITALGHKYHLEHFKCSACGKVFESDESYYEHGSDIFCHFHYLKLFALKCEGCHSSIVKQFVELYKGGKNQQWHPECYMVFKFWNVSFTSESVGLPKDFPFDSMTSLESPSLSAALLQYEQKIESFVLNCWMVLSGFEETTAQCVSEILLSASTGNLAAGLLVTGKLILYVEVLFNALEFVQNMCLENLPEKTVPSEANASPNDEIYSADAFQRFQRLRKEPRNVSGKIMSCLAILRKSHEIAASGSLSSELLSVITGCAHYFKLLIRIGLNNALKLNVLRGDTVALDTFLLLISRYDEIEAADKLAGAARVSISSRLSIPCTATDACRSCSKSIEKSCVRFGDSRWHNKCFECSQCHRKLSSDFKPELFLRGQDDLILCLECIKVNTNTGRGYSSGFVAVSDLSQLLYLLRIAMLRSKAAIKKEIVESKITALTQVRDIHGQTVGAEKGYSKTLDEVTALRTKRESQSLHGSVKRMARKSVVLDLPAGTSATADSTSPFTERKCLGSNGSRESFVSLLNEDFDQTEFQIGRLQIREESSLRLVSNSLDRTTDLLKNEKLLTLDDIPRIVAAEQAREQRPNAFKHHNLLYQKRQQLLKTPGAVHSRVPSNNVSQGSHGFENAPTSYQIKYYSELSKREHFLLRHIAVEAFLKVSPQFSREELVALVQTTKKLSNFWDKFRFGADKHPKGLTVFGVDLSDVCKRYGVDLELGVGPSQLRIPILVDDVIRALRQKDMSVEGIFRLNGNIKNLRTLTEQINAAPLKSPAFDKYSAVQLAALMKKWLRELPNPLLMFNLYELWITSRKQTDAAKRKRILQLTYCMLPRCHRNLLEVLLYFFSWVASFAEIDEETGSKMDTHNLATVIAPNVLFSRASATDNGTNQSSEAHFLAIEVVNQLIEMHEELAVIPGDIWGFYKNLNISASKLEQLSTKEIMSKIQKILSENPFWFDGSLKLDAIPSHNNTIKRGQATVHVNEAVAT